MAFINLYQSVIFYYLFFTVMRIPFSLLRIDWENMLKCHENIILHEIVLKIEFSSCKMIKWYIYSIINVYKYIVSIYTSWLFLLYFIFYFFILLFNDIKNMYYNNILLHRVMYFFTVMNLFIFLTNNLKLRVDVLKSHENVLHIFLLFLKTIFSSCKMQLFTFSFIWMFL